MLTQIAARELAPLNINVNAVAPGLTRIPMVAAAGEDSLRSSISEGPLANLFARISEPDDIAAAITFHCLPSSRQITGQVMHMSAGAVL